MKDTRTLLDDALSRINVPGFVDDDPVQFPRRYTDCRDIEIATMLCSTIAWGNRKMILRDCNRLLTMMGDAPYDYVRFGDYDTVDDALNIHRTFFGRNLKYFLRGLAYIYDKFGSLEAYAAARQIDKSALPAWELAAALSEAFSAANQGATDSRCISASVTTPLKRLNMALRWLVRDDGIVDMGLWNVLTPAQLYIPLDVHVADVSRALGLLNRRSNDRKAVEMLTAQLRQWRPDDPTAYDFALFGIGIEMSRATSADKSEQTDRSMR